MEPAGEFLLLVFRQLLKEQRRNPRFHRWCPHDESLATQGLRYEPAVWLQRTLSGRERMFWMRALQRTVEMGWIVPVLNHGRTRFVQPTIKGLEQAELLASETESVMFLAFWLQHTVWGKEIAQAWDRKFMGSFDWSSLAKQSDGTDCGLSSV
jgi:hypothetical protein